MCGVLTTWGLSYVLTGALYNWKECVVNIDGTTSFTHNSADNYGGKCFLAVISIERREAMYDPS